MVRRGKHKHTKLSSDVFKHPQWHVSTHDLANCKDKVTKFRTGHLGLGCVTHDLVDAATTFVDGDLIPTVFARCSRTSAPRHGIPTRSSITSGARSTKSPQIGCVLLETSYHLLVVCRAVAPMRSIGPWATIWLAASARRLEVVGERGAASESGLERGVCWSIHPTLHNY